MKNAAFILTFLFAAGAAQAGWFDECEHRAHRSAQIDMAHVSHVVLNAKAGSLRVQGHDGVRTLPASGEACSSDHAVLAYITLTATPSGPTAPIEADLPS